MKQASLIVLILGSVLTIVGLFPCIGWLNWVALPVDLVAMIVGIIGLATDKDPETGTQRAAEMHVAALVGGAILASISAFRCLMGGGLI